MFKEIIGQKQAKARLQFLIKAGNKVKDGKLVNITQPVMLIASKGAGKTTMAKAFVDSMLDQDGHQRFQIGLNGAQLKNNTDFVNLVLRPMQEQDCVVCFVDEAHDVSKSIQTRLLSVFNVEDSPIRIFKFQDEEFEIDLRKHCFVFATTNAENVLPPLLERFTEVQLKFYSDKEIKQILDFKIDKLKINACPKVIQLVSIESRQSPREAMHNVAELSRLSSVLDKKIQVKDWQDHCNHQGFLPLGLKEGELNTLRSVCNHGEVALGVIASELNCSSASVKDVYEPYLLNRGMIRRDGKRIATEAGRAALAYAEKVLA